MAKKGQSAFVSDQDDFAFVRSTPRAQRVLGRNLCHAPRSASIYVKVRESEAISRVEERREIALRRQRHAPAAEPGG